jgi:hypothetical protein
VPELCCPDPPNVDTLLEHREVIARRIPFAEIMIAAIRFAMMLVVVTVAVPLLNGASAIWLSAAEMLEVESSILDRDIVSGQRSAAGVTQQIRRLEAICLTEKEPLVVIYLTEEGPVQFEESPQRLFTFMFLV